MAESDTFKALLELIALLRQRCPWDREQTHLSLRSSLLEECYEVLETIDSGQPEELCQELGDLLMQVLLHAQIAAEAGHFDMEAVMLGMRKKLIYRHPHVFGETKLQESQQVVEQWHRLKREEGQGTLLDNIPTSLPALAYSQEIQQRVATEGFDWPEVAGVVEKLVEEVGELAQAATTPEKEAEWGDVLFTLSNVARRRGVDMETALRLANSRFRERYDHMAKLCQAQGLRFSQLSFSEQNALWEEAKKEVP
ncbi:MAG: nucleoside triphosphate pyrophosphohydrolase [Chloroflexota bacterium]